MADTAAAATSSASKPAAAAPPAPVPMTGPNAVSKLAALPPELVDNIAVKLGSDDLFNLRLTCKDVENKCFSQFTKEYFTEKSFMFTTESLKVLVSIANSDRLKDKLKHIWIVTASIPSRCLSCPHGRDCCYQPTVRQKEALIGYVRDQKNLRKTRQDKKMLVEAFSKLPELHRLSFTDYLRELSEGAECRGLNKFSRTTGTQLSFAPVSPSTAPEYYEWLTHVFRTMLGAVVNSGIKSLTTFETNFQSHHYGVSPISDLNFKEDFLEKLASAFANLKQFSIQLRSTHMRKGRDDQESDMQSAIKRIKAFASVARAASGVRLSCDFTDSSGKLSKALANSLDLASIKQLKMDSIVIDLKSLAIITQRLTSVEKLSFHQVELNTGSWVAMLKVIQQLPKLGHLHLQFLQQDMKKVYFLKQPDLENPNAANPFFDPNMPMDHDHDDDDWSDDDTDDDEPPELIPQDQVDSMPAVDTAPTAPAASDADAIKVPPAKPAKKCDQSGGRYHQPPGAEHIPERGHYICLPTRKDIDEQIPTFIEQCNLGSENDPMDLFGGIALGPPIAVPLGAVPAPAGGNAGAPGVNGQFAQQMMNSLANAFGLPPGSVQLPPGVANPPQQGQNAGGNPPPPPQATAGPTGNVHVPPPLPPGAWAQPVNSPAAPPHGQAPSTAGAQPAQAVDHEAAPTTAGADPGAGELPDQWMNDDEWVNDVD